MVSRLELTFSSRLARPVLPGDFPALDQVAKMAVKEKQKFERLEMSKEDLLKMFAVRCAHDACSKQIGCRD